MDPIYDPIKGGLFIYTSVVLTLYLAKKFYASGLAKPKYMSNPSKLKRRRAYILVLGFTPTVFILLISLFANWPR